MGLNLFWTLTALSLGFPQEIGQQLVAFIGEHALRVELHPLQVLMLPVPQAHDRAVLEPGGHLEAVRQGFALGDQGVIAGCLLYTSPSPRDGLLSRMPSSA